MESKRVFFVAQIDWNSWSQNLLSYPYQLLRVVTRLDSDNDEVSFGEKYELLGRAVGGPKWGWEAMGMGIFWGGFWKYCACTSRTNYKSKAYKSLRHVAKLARNLGEALPFGWNPHWTTSSSMISLAVLTCCDSQAYFIEDFFEFFRILMR